MSAAVYVMNYLQNLLKRGFEYVGLYYSHYQGFVADVEDPLGMGRIKVMVPLVNKNDAIPVWALPIGMYAANGYGSRVLPRVGDTVWVSFQMGNPRKPLWQHGYFAKEELPSQYTHTQQYFFHSPAGHNVLIDDTEGLIRISLADGKIVEINEQGISLGSISKSAEPVAKADTLVEKLETLITTLQNAKTATSLGPQPFMPITQQKLLDLKSELDEIKSEHVTTD